MSERDPCLLADIGGTHARFGWLPGPGEHVAHVRRLAVADYPDVTAAARHYMEQLPAADAPRAAAFAVATAVQGDRVSFTNSAWSFSICDVQDHLGLRTLRVINDFEALALSLPGLRPDQMRIECGPPLAALTGGTLAVVGPGTGLGVAGLTRTPGGWWALPGEGGHATVSPMDDLESAVVADLQQRTGHVSAERVLSGIGLPTLHTALARVRGEPVDPRGAPEIVEAAGRGDPAAGRTLDLFCSLLGTFSGNVALILGARQGLFIGGGLIPRFADRFFASRFRERFEAKGRFSAYLREIPTPVLTDTLTALQGAAAALRQPR